MKNYKKIIAATLVMTTMASATGCGLPTFGMGNNNSSSSSKADTDNHSSKKEDTDKKDNVTKNNDRDTQEPTDGIFDIKDDSLPAGEYRLTVDNTDFNVTFGSGCDVTQHDGYIELQKDIDGKHYISLTYEGGYVDLYDTSEMQISDIYRDTYNYIDYEDARSFAVNGESGYVSYVTYRDDSDDALWITGKIWQDVGLEHYLEISFSTNFGDYLRDIDELVECGIISLSGDHSSISNTSDDTNTPDDTNTTTNTNHSSGFAAFVGNYKTDDEITTSYLDITSSPDEIAFKLSFADGWTFTDNFTVIDDDTISGTCDFYYSASESEDYVSFTLEKIGDSIYMTIDSSDCPLLSSGDMYVFSAY